MTSARNLSSIETKTRTRYRRLQRNLFAVVAFIFAACLPTAVSFAASPNGQIRKAVSAPTPLAPGAYFGLKLPEETPEIFAPAIISIPGRSVGNVVFSPDATECYFTVFDGAWANPRILFTRYDNGAWTPPALATFADGRQENAMLFSRDGNRLYFGVSTSPSVTELWMVQRTSREEEWSKPQPLPAPLNSLFNSFKAQFFCRQRMEPCISSPTAMSDTAISTGRSPGPASHCRRRMWGLRSTLNLTRWILASRRMVIL